MLPFTANTPYAQHDPGRGRDHLPGRSRAGAAHQATPFAWERHGDGRPRQPRQGRAGGHIQHVRQLGHASAEIGFNHFFRAPKREEGFPGDLIFYQGHAARGMYARAFLEGRTGNEDHLMELPPQSSRRSRGSAATRTRGSCVHFAGSSPTVSMGLGPIGSIYQARFMRYLENRGLIPKSSAKVWCFVGDGESDEPETLGAINLAVREKLDNLIWVVKCYLQRLVGPVRGNGKIIQELERIFRGSGLEHDQGHLGQRLGPDPRGRRR